MFLGDICPFLPFRHFERVIASEVSAGIITKTRFLFIDVIKKEQPGDRTDDECRPCDATLIVVT